jgi:hypothetical protein
LISSLKDRELRKTSMEILERIGSLWIPNLKIICRQADPEVREAAIQILAKIDPNAFHPDSIKRELTAEEKQIVGWFESVNVELKECLQPLQVFWCIGVVDREAFLSGTLASGINKLPERLSQLKPTFNCLPLPLSSGYIRNTCLEILSSLFNQNPFLGAAWSDDEQMSHLRIERGVGKKKWGIWSPRARKAWHYVDRFLTLRGLLPQIMALEN